MSVSASYGIDSQNQLRTLKRVMVFCHLRYFLLPHRERQSQYLIEKYAELLAFNQMELVSVRIEILLNCGSWYAIVSVIFCVNR